MSILLVDADSKKGFPNLALMKLSAWYKAQGHDIDFIKGLPEAPPLELYDRSYISVIYEKNRQKALDYALILPNSIIGGTGWSLDNALEQKIEHIHPDYSLYDIDYSMGFTSRGCIRHCAFCVVPTKEGHIRDHAPIEEFHDPTHKKMILLDNNFLASPRFRENIQYLIDNKIQVNFNQGLDIRLLTKEVCDLLVQCKFTTWNFNARRLSFAFDSMRDEKAVRKGVEMLKNAGIAASSIMVYILVGWNTSITQDLHRVRVIRDIGAWPYIMRYNGSNGESGILKHLARWVNRRVYHTVDFADYDYSDSKESYHKAFSKYCMHG